MNDLVKRYKKCKNICFDCIENGLTIKYLANEFGINYMQFFNFLNKDSKVLKQKTIDKIEIIEKYFDNKKK